MLHRFYARLLLLFIGLLAAVGHMVITPANAQEDFLDPDVAFVMSAAMSGPHELRIHYKIAPEYYMYRTRFTLASQPDPDLVGAVAFPPGLVKFDETFGEDLEVYYRQVTLVVPLKPGASAPQTLDITSQGCADAGLCYPPITKSLTLTPGAGGYTVSGPGATDVVPEPLSTIVNPAEKTTFAAALQSTDMGLAGYLAQADAVTIIALALVLGVLLTFTPCVLPMVPIVLAVIAGSQGTGAPPGRWRGLSLAAVYLLGVSLLYTAMGVAAGLVGAGLAAWLQTPWVLSLFAVLLALLALAMFNVYNLQAPSQWQSALSERLSRIPGGHYSGAFIMGLLSALIVGPCVAAPLAGVLLFISQTGDWVLGGSALFALAWGQGALLLVLGAGSGALLPKAGPWMEGVRQAFGVMLLATAWWMLNPVLPDIAMVLGWVVLAMWTAVLLGMFRRVDAGVWAYLRKACGAVLAVWAVLMLVGVASGTYSVLQPLSGLAAQQASGPAANTGLTGGVPALGNASSNGQTLAGPALANIKSQFVKVASVQELDHLLANSNRPVLLDFYADWCVSCIEMERFTFTDPTVAGLMQQFVLVQADVTKNTDDDRALLRRFSLFGPPGIMFFKANGQQLADERVVGFMKAPDFAVVLQRALAAEN